MNILFVIDDLELKYFEFNDLVTDFWLIKEYLQRGYDVDICIKSGLFIKENRGFCLSYKAFEKDNNIFYEKKSSEKEINSFSIVYFRPDPPVDIDYINACFVFDFVDRNRTKIINNTKSILDFNEKMHGNYFPKFTPQNIITANINLIKDFVAQRGEAIIKPLNRCFGNGIFYLNSKDKNINSLINISTNNGQTLVCVQEYLGHGQGGDKRAFIIGRKVYSESLRKLPGKDDFRFNTHSDEFFKKEYLTKNEYQAAIEIGNYLTERGIYMVALDLIDEKVTEINVTSPCYFFREMNRLHQIEFNKIVMQDLINLTENEMLVTK
jgi:glutathione synthase